MEQPLVASSITTGAGVCPRGLHAACTFGSKERSPGCRSGRATRRTTSTRPEEWYAARIEAHRLPEKCTTPVVLGGACPWVLLGMLFTVEGEHPHINKPACLFIRGQHCARCPVKRPMWACLFLGDPSQTEFPCSFPLRNCLESP